MRQITIWHNKQYKTTIGQPEPTATEKVGYINGSQQKLKNVYFLFRVKMYPHTPILGHLTFFFQPIRFKPLNFYYHKITENVTPIKRLKIRNYLDHLHTNISSSTFTSSPIFLYDLTFKLWQYKKSIPNSIFTFEIALKQINPFRTKPVRFFIGVWTAVISVPVRWVSHIC